jgi:archaellum component FlaC
MAFTVQEYLDLVRLLAEHPEWRSELRRLLVSEELLALPEIVRGLAGSHQRVEERLSRVEERLGRLEAIVEALAEAQRRTEERLGRTEERLARLEAAVEALAEAQRRTEERLARLEAAVEALAEAQRRTEERVEALAEAQRRTEERMGELEAIAKDLAIITKTLIDDMAELRGKSLETTYRDKAGAYFGSILRRTRVVALDSLEEKLEASLSDEEYRDVLFLDLVVKGKPRQRPDISEVFLAVEISAVIYPEDVERARRRASLLCRGDYLTIPMVAGKQITSQAEEVARLYKVAILQDGGKVSFWEEALQAWIDQPERNHSDK